MATITCKLDLQGESLQSVVLLSVIRDLTEGKPLPLEVKGIEYMNDDPAMVDVLYAKVNMKDGSDKWVNQLQILSKTSHNFKVFILL